MLTKDAALARLRAAGTLATGKGLPNTIAASALSSPMARAAMRVVDGNRRVTGPRALAPSAYHAVLP